MIELSVVIPVYNEGVLLASSIRELHTALQRWKVPFEILIVENGSRDDTVSRAEQLLAQLAEVRLLRVGEPNYGLALRTGIERARGRYVHCEEIDICDLGFHERARALLLGSEADLVIGSKAMPGAWDRRPWLRRTATLVINGLLRVTLGYRGTDTHGLKAFRNEALRATVAGCVLEHDMFASELVIRAQRAGLSIREIPVTIQEKRQPSVALLRRVPRAAWQLARLWWAMRKP